VWQIANLAESGLRYPLDAPIVPDAYYSIEIRLGADILMESSENEISFIEPLTCACGFAQTVLQEIRRREVFHHEKFPANCPWCGVPNQITAVAKIYHHSEDAWLFLHGGGCYRTALVVDCGKMYPDAGVSITPELVAVFERFFGVKSRLLQTVF
jgi:hypothetical protein